jgi:hypothetical protein
VKKLGINDRGFKKVKRHQKIFQGTLKRVSGDTQNIVRRHPNRCQEMVSGDTQNGVRIYPKWCQDTPKMVSGDTQNGVRKKQAPLNQTPIFSKSLTAKSHQSLLFHLQCFLNSKLKKSQHFQESLISQSVNDHVHCHDNFLRQ